MDGVVADGADARLVEHTVRADTGKQRAAMKKQGSKAHRDSKSVGSSPPKRTRKSEGRSAKDAAVRYLRMALLELEGENLTAAQLLDRLAREDSDRLRGERTIARDRHFVRQRFLPLILDALNEAQTTPAEALIHQLVRQHLDRLVPPITQSEISAKRRAAASVLERGHASREGQWRHKIATLSSDALHDPPQLPEDTWRTVADALYRGRQLRLRYQRAGASRVSNRTLHPLGLVLRYPVLYLIACTDDPAKVGWYALHRMSDMEILDLPAIEPAGFSLSRFLAHDPGLGQHVGEIDLELDVSEDIVHYLHERPFPGQTLDPPDENGWCRLRIRIEQTDQLVAWIRSWGPALRVMSPTSLRRQLMQDLRETQAFYRERRR